MSAPIPTVEDRPLEQLTEWARNPRRISKPRLEALKRALVAEPEMLQARPLIALPDGTVVAGNQRLRAARELGWPTLPTVTVDLDEARAAEWALRDNRGYGEDDERLVGALLAELAADGRALDLTGYDSGEVDRLLAAVRPAPVVDPDDAPPLPLEPKSVRGEVYELGPHRLMCGDATSQADVVRLQADEPVSAIVTDPPYGVGVDYGAFDDTIDNVKPLINALVALIDTVPCAVVTSGHRVMWLYPPPQWVMAWVHPAGNGRGPWGFSMFNPILCYGPDPYLAHGRGSQPDTLVMAADRGDEIGHPVIKPMQVWQWLVNRVTPMADAIVLDPFAGSGTTVIACELLRRRALCMEIDPAYCDVIRQRYADFTGQPELAP